MAIMNHFDLEEHLVNKDREAGWFKHFLKPCIAELVGTTLFVFVGCMSVVTGPTINMALTHGFGILVLVAGLGSVSGGHFNPAVSLGAVLAGGLSPLLALSYFFCQILGGLLGAGLVKGVMPTDMYSSIGGGAQQIAATASPGQAILCEMIITSIIVVTYIMTTIDTDNKNAAVPIGVSVIVAVLSGTAVSGASMNPARSFGPAVVISSQTLRYWSHHYVFWVGPVLGSLLASLLYRFLLGNDDKRIVFN